MADIFDYLHWRGDLNLAQLPFNPADGLILSWFASLRLTDPLPPTVGQAAAQMDSDFAQALACSPRFKDMQLYRFEEQFSESEEMQFAAVTILTGDGRIFVAFRGTDSTLVGWKEDFNMSFMDEVPAQREAVDYINRIGMELKLPLRTGGHSKGGNLAVYASSMCHPAVQRRIETVYNFDGPGLSSAAAQSDGHRRIEPRIETFLPESSIVGILLERSNRYHVVQSSAQGAMQHSPFSWQTTPTGFVLLDELGWQSLYADRTIRDWLSNMPAESRKTFVNALYDIAESTDARTLNEIDWQKSGGQMLEAFDNLDLRTKAVLILSLSKLISSALRNLNSNRKE